MTLRLHWLTRMPKGCRLPRYRLIELGDGKNVMAMERFNRTLAEIDRYSVQGILYWSLRDELQNALRLWDLHRHNLAIDEENNLLVPIDLGA
jgi:hypothetical protein